MAGSKLRVAIAGLGRIGKHHAMNFYDSTQRALVVAVSSPDAGERRWVERNLESVEIYADFDQMLEQESLRAVVVASATSVRAEQALKAIAKGYHVLCEEPLSSDPDMRAFPTQKVMRAFPRRFDASYRRAYDLVSSGSHGPPVVFRSQTANLHDTTGNPICCAGTKGGIFLDCSIHDIDLMLWFLGEDRNLTSVQAAGVSADHPELNARDDRDNALAILEFDGGKTANLYCSRMMAVGQGDATEIICERGSFRVNTNGRKDRVEIRDTYGARRELPQHYYERFREAFITEALEFTASCLDEVPVPVSLGSSVRVIEIADVLQRSLVSGKKIVFDRQGNERPRVSARL